MKETLTHVLSEVLNKPITVTALQDDTDLIQEFGLSSLDMMQFILKVENAFDITVDIERLDLNSFRNLSRLLEFINSCPARN